MGAGRSVTVKVIASVTTICASLIISYQCTHLHHISFTSRSLHTSSKQKQKPVLVQNSRLEPRSSARADRSSDGMDAICLSSADVAISDVGSVHIQRTSRNHISSITYGSAHISLPCPFRTHDNVVGLGQSQTGAPLTGSSPALPRLSSFLSFLLSSSAVSRDALGFDGARVDHRQIFNHRYPIGIGTMTIVIDSNSEIFLA